MADAKERTSGGQRFEFAESIPVFASPEMAERQPVLEVELVFTVRHGRPQGPLVEAFRAPAILPRKAEIAGIAAGFRLQFGMLLSPVQQRFLHLTGLLVVEGFLPVLYPAHCPYQAGEAAVIMLDIRHQQPHQQVNPADTHNRRRDRNQPVGDCQEQAGRNDAAGQHHHKQRDNPGKHFFHKGRNCFYQRQNAAGTVLE